jgi:hypothetical protein
MTQGGFVTAIANFASAIEIKARILIEIGEDAFAEPPCRYLAADQAQPCRRLWIFKRGIDRMASLI